MYLYHIPRKLCSASAIEETLKTFDAWEESDRTAECGGFENTWKKQRPKYMYHDGTIFNIVILVDCSNKKENYRSSTQQAYKDIVQESRHRLTPLTRINNSFVTLDAHPRLVSTSHLLSFVPPPPSDHVSEVNNSILYRTVFE